MHPYLEFLRVENAGNSAHLDNIIKKKKTKKNASFWKLTDQNSMQYFCCCDEITW